MRRLERSPCGNRLVSEARCWCFAASSQIRRGKPSGELRERQTMETKGRALLHRDRCARGRPLPHATRRAAALRHQAETDRETLVLRANGSRLRGIELREGGSLHLHPGLHAGTIGYGGASLPQCGQSNTAKATLISLAGFGMAIKQTAPEPVLPFATQRKFAAWLAKHHADSSGVWIQTRQGGVRHPVDQVCGGGVETALCWGCRRDRQSKQSGSMSNWYVQRRLRRAASAAPGPKSRTVRKRALSSPPAR